MKSGAAATIARALLPEEQWARVDRYRLEDAGFGTDRFGAATEGLAVAYALGFWFHEHYFRVDARGHEHIPERGAAVVVSNHSGVLPFDGMMIATDVFRAAPKPRLVRYMVDYFVYRVPFLGTFFRSLGQIPGTRANFDGLVRAGHLVGVFPEGARALGKPRERRYELFPFSEGHVELAARHGVPVVPLGLVGAEEQHTVLGDVPSLARLLHLPFFPITRTFPWLGPLGLLPRRVRYYITYGEPLHVDPAALHDMATRVQEVERVRETVRELLALGRGRRDREEGPKR